jgi:hypothetical protein
MSCRAGSIRASEGAGFHSQLAGVCGIATQPRRVITATASRAEGQLLLLFHASKRAVSHHTQQVVAACAAVDAEEDAPSTTRAAVRRERQFRAKSSVASGDDK